MVEKHYFSTGATRLHPIITAYNSMTVDLKPHLRAYMTNKTAVNLWGHISERRLSKGVRIRFGCFPTDGTN